MAKRDYYDVLGVSKTATPEEIKKSYRTLAKKYHPDVSKEKDAEAKFKEVNEAYETLSDEKKKAMYDQYGHDANNMGSGGSGFGGFGGFGDINDIFSSFFGGGRRQQRSSNQSSAGADLEMKMTIDFMEAVLGCKKTIQVNFEDNCPKCHGSGAESTKDIEICSKCKGAGEIVIQQRTMLGNFQQRTVCPDCRGTGKFIKNKCNQCNGNGRVRNTSKVDITIPAGIDNGMTLRITGQGNAGYNGGSRGDLYITFQVRPHKIFKRDGFDIHLSIPLTIAQVVLGDVVEVPTIYGDVKMTIPAGTDPGSVLRLREKGIKNTKTGKIAGSQLIFIEVKTPKNLTNEQKELYRRIDNLESHQRKSGWQKFKDLFK